MKNPFSRFFRARDKPQDSVSQALSFSFGTAGSGKSVNARSAVQLSTVYACVRVIAETIASLPFAVYVTSDKGSEKALDHPLYRMDMLGFLKIRAWNAQHEKKKKESRRSTIDQVWPGLSPNVAG